MTLSWKSAFTWFARDPGWQRKLALGGLFFFPFPPLGWILALGFRSLAGARLVEGIEPVLPGWRGELARAFRRGLGAEAVILAYFTPFLAAYWALGRTSWAPLAEHPVEILAFFAGIVVFPPLFLPALPLVYAQRYEWLQLSPGEAAFLLALFLATVFVLPAAFVQVSLCGRYRAAARIGAALRFIGRSFGAYCEAWCLSLLASAAAVAAGPLAPWGLFWSYLVILYTFNEVLVRSDTAEARARFAKSRYLPPLADAA